MTLRPFLQACGTAILLLSQSMRVDAQNKSFVMETPESIMAGETLLQPGSYVWQLLDSHSNRNIVQITNQKTGHVEATILAFPAFRRVPSESNELIFWETPAGYSHAVRNWFYPGDNYGQEFPYPKHLNPVIAAVQPPVFQTLLPTKPVERHASVAPRQTPKATPPQKPATVNATPSEDEGSWAVISDGPKTDPAPSTTPHHASLWDRVKNLPLTATLAPLIGLLGLAALGLFFLTRKKRKHPLAVQ